MYPGYEFKVTDALITNFHLPQSTLIMLVSALCGREKKVLNAYEIAVKERYRFFSFGECYVCKIEIIYYLYNEKLTIGSELMYTLIKKCGNAKKGKI